MKLQHRALYLTSGAGSANEKNVRLVFLALVLISSAHLSSSHHATRRPPFVVHVSARLTLRVHWTNAGREYKNARRR